MKKGIIVLLIAVLVAGVAFAADAKFTGNAKIGYEVNLDGKNHGIFNSQGMEFSFAFEFATAEGGSTGEGKIYAEIAAEASLGFELKKKSDGATATPTLSAEITKANIVAGDLTINILGPEGAYDYASLYIKDPDGYSICDFANAYEVDDHGFVATYKDFSVALSYYYYKQAFKAHTPKYEFDTKTGLAKDIGKDTPELDKHELYVGLQTPAFEVADGMTVRAGANFKLVANNLTETNTINIGGGVDFNFAPEDSKLSAYAAADAEMEKEGDADATLPVDIMAGAKYDFVYADVYFGTANKFEEDSNILGARVGANYAVNDQITVSGSAETLWEIVGDLKPVLSFAAGIDYKADAVAAYAKAEITLQDLGDGYELKKWTYPDGKATPTIRRGLGISAGVSSTAIIDNATVALDWTKADFSKKNADDVEALGLIQASIKVAF